MRKHFYCWTCLLLLNSFLLGAATIRPAMAAPTAIDITLNVDGASSYQVFELENGVNTLVDSGTFGTPTGGGTSDITWNVSSLLNLPAVNTNIENGDIALTNGVGGSVADVVEFTGNHQVGDYSGTIELFTGASLPTISGPSFSTPYVALGSAYDPQSQSTNTTESGIMYQPGYTLCGTSYAFITVVPEASTLGICATMGLPILGVAARRFRRRRA